MFRCIQKLTVPMPSHVIQVELRPNKAGRCVSEKVNLSTTRLPDPVNFDLKTLLEAGVNLEEVNSKVLGGSSVNAVAVLDKYNQKTEPSNDKEN